VLENVWPEVLIQFWRRPPRLRNQPNVFATVALMVDKACRRYIPSIHGVDSHWINVWIETEVEVAVGKCRSPGTGPMFLATGFVTYYSNRARDFDRLIQLPLQSIYFQVVILRQQQFQVIVAPIPTCDGVLKCRKI
jgi:hypothetical protein